MPKRPKNHQLETWSTQKFGSMIPSEWVVRTVDSDYGIDARVEIFEGGQATGLFFNVQLKSHSKAAKTATATIKRTTLNYWDALSDPTLVILAVESSDQIWFQWSHLLPWDENSTTKSRRIQFSEPLTPESAPDILVETRAFRRARQLYQHLPIEVHITGPVFYGEPSGVLKHAVSSKLAPVVGLRVVYHAPSTPYFFVDIYGDGLLVGLRGSRTRQLTWDFTGPRDYGVVASDVLSAIAFEAARVGAEDLAVELLRISAVDSEMLLGALGVGTAMAILTRRNESDAVLTLVRRTYAVENHPSGAIVMTAFISRQWSPATRRSVAYLIRDAARTWEHPAVAYYNAGNLLSADDPAEAINLYDQAAHADAAYRSRAYWWREKGSLHWTLHQVDEAISCYGEAVSAGDGSARPLLADALMRTGHYASSRTEFESADLHAPQMAQWRLSTFALDYIIDHFGIEDQTRPKKLLRFEVHSNSGDDIEKAVLDALSNDALNGWAHWAMSPLIRARGESALASTLTAAVCLLSVPAIWQEVIIDAFGDRSLADGTRLGIVKDALICARAYCGASFEELLHLDEHVPDHLRENFLVLFDAFRPPSRDVEVRRHRDSGTDSVFVPRGDSRLDDE